MSGISVEQTPTRATLLRLGQQIANMLSRYRDYIPLVLTLVLLLTAVWGYRGSQAEKIGPPLGAITGQDFRQILSASQDIEEGKNLYARALAYGNTPTFEEFITWDAAPYPYPPLVAVLALPLLQLPTDTALQLWTTVNLALLVGSAFIIVAAFTTGSRLFQRGTRFVLIVTLLCVYFPTQHDLKLVQLDILILFLLLLTYLLYQRGSITAGLPLALAIAVKPIVAPMVFFFVWKGQWRIVFLAGISAALLTAWGFVVVGWERLPDYMQVNRLWSSGGILHYPFNQSVNGFTQRLFTENRYIEPLVVLPWLARVLTIGAGLLAVGSWIGSVSRSHSPKHPTGAIEYGLTLTTLMFLSPLIDDIHFVWALLPITVLLLATIDHAQGIGGGVLLAISFAIALYLGYPALLDKIYAGYETLLHDNTLVSRSNALLTGAYLYGLIALHGCIVVYLYLRRNEQRGR